MKPSRPWALAEGVAANVIWASTFVFVKLALTEAGPLTVAGLRYFAGFLLLVPLMVHRGDHRGSLLHGVGAGLAPARSGDRKGAPLRRVWVRLLLLGLTGYTIGNGALFWGLKYMPATTGSLLISLTPLPVLLLSILWLRERTTGPQIVGLAICLVGSFLFLSPGGSAGEPLGIGLGVIALLSFATFGTLGREAARDRRVDTLSLTAIPLGLGGGVLLLLAFPLEGIPDFSGSGWAIILWLAVINTAFAYLLYNHALKTLTALEMNVMFNLGPVGTALIAWPLLGEQLSAVQIAGMVMVILGVVGVQAGRESQ